MKVVIYDRIGSKPIREFMEGVVANGDHPLQHNPNVWDGGIDKEADAVVVNGLGRVMSPIYRAYKTRGVPIVVVEQGHIGRAHPGSGTVGYWQVGIDRLNWLPPHECPDDRRELLKLEPPKHVKRNPKGPILFMGQKAGDAQTFNFDLNVWHSRVMRHMRTLTDRLFIYRPHPLDKTGRLPWGEEYGVQEPDVMTLNDAFAEAWATVTFNSNAGLKAILQGVPVFCDDRAFYAPVASTKHDEIEADYSLDQQAWRAMLNRIAYSQWNFSEIAQGKAWAFIKEELEEAHAQKERSI